MQDLLTTLLVALIAGAIPAGVLSTSHYLLKPRRWPPVANYSFGSFWVFSGVTGFLWFYTRDFGLIAGCWIVLGLCGMSVAGCYAVDKAQNRASEEIARNDANRSDL